MLTMRASKDRGHFKNEWLDSYHSFSFGEYYDPKHMNYRDLRVINQDVIAGASGFPTHGHRDMEIITYVLRGTLEHKDSLGNKAQIKPGEIQVMTAGTGVMHSEYNPDAKVAAEILQIWVVPSQRGLAPGYKQKMFSNEDKRNNLLLIASPDGDRGSMKINQDVRLYAGVFDKDFQKRYEPKEGRGTWIQVAKGSLIVNKQTIAAGDGVAIEKENLIRIEGGPQGAEFILFDLK
ncbi:pirin family protein [Bdellovibrio sp. HCB337]|uniref:pirin family protein n=1 Tax=Bdellovibrio sp. HCB337 TaxID=3394358 RepID=UPI0039A5036A